MVQRTLSHPSPASSVRNAGRAAPSRPKAGSFQQPAVSQAHSRTYLIVGIEIRCSRDRSADISRAMDRTGMAHILPGTYDTVGHSRWGSSGCSGSRSESITWTHMLGSAKEVQEHRPSRRQTDTHSSSAVFGDDSDDCRPVGQPVHVPTRRPAVRAG